MLTLSRKSKGIAVLDIWYAKHRSKEKGIIRYHEADTPILPSTIPFLTLVSDLTLTKEEMLSKFSKNCRYEIRRAEREMVTTEAFMGDTLTPQRITEFCEFFKEFWASKGTEIEIDHLQKEISQYETEGCFMIARASVHNKPIVYHTYIVTQKRARLYQSASLYREDDEIPAATVGMANRYLHKEDMLYFKNIGKTSYDWGGAGIEKEVENITKFKESFGGEHVTFYDGEEVNGILPKLAALFLKYRNK